MVILALELRILCGSLSVITADLPSEKSFVQYGTLARQAKSAVVR
jgi:hypothetical protein